MQRRILLEETVCFKSHHLLLHLDWFRFNSPKPSLNQIWIDPNVDLNLSTPNSVMEMPKEISEACQGNQQGLELVCDCIVLRDIRITFSCSS